MFGQICSSWQNKHLCRRFGSSMVWFASIRVSGPLSSEHISDIGSDMGLGRSVQILSLRSVLSCLILTFYRLEFIYFLIKTYNNC